MKVKHKNSGEVLDLTTPLYYKSYGMYGYLVLTANKDVIFFPATVENYGWEDFSNLFEVLF